MARLQNLDQILLSSKSDLNHVMLEKHISVSLGSCHEDAINNDVRI